MGRRQAMESDPEEEGYGGESSISEGGAEDGPQQEETLDHIINVRGEATSPECHALWRLFSKQMKKMSLKIQHYLEIGSEIVIISFDEVISIGFDKKRFP